jgi:hypothetical protein
MGAPQPSTSNQDIPPPCRGRDPLKGWKVLAKLRRCPRRATTIVQAVLVVHVAEADRHPR